MKWSKRYEYRRLIYPTFVPIRLLGLLESGGLDTTDKVHQAIEDDTLTDIKGIGKKTAGIIINIYTLYDDGVT